MSFDNGELLLKLILWLYHHFIGLNSVAPVYDFSLLDCNLHPY